MHEWITVYEKGAKAISPRRPDSVPFGDAKKALTDVRASERLGVDVDNKVEAMRKKRKRDKTTLTIKGYSPTYLAYTTNFLGKLNKQGVSGIPRGVRAELKIKLRQILKQL